MHTIDHRYSIPYFHARTAAQLVHEIDCPTPADLAKVVRHTKELDNRRQLSGEELGELAQQMIDATHPAEVERLKEAIIKGFYGDR